jgi:hypothetical protein
LSAAPGAGRELFARPFGSALPGIVALRLAPAAAPAGPLGAGSVCSRLKIQNQNIKIHCFLSGGLISVKCKAIFFAKSRQPHTAGIPSIWREWQSSM